MNSLFVVSSSELYAGCQNGDVYYSNNSGSSWTAINGSPDGSPIASISMYSNTLYVATGNEYAYTSTSITGGGSWTWYGQTVYRLFVSGLGTIYAGTQGGYVYSLTTGDEIGFVAASPINSLFIVG